MRGSKGAYRENDGCQKSKLFIELSVYYGYNAISREGKWPGTICQREKSSLGVLNL
ncbi:MAG: hypothetical protein JRJ29_09985 [Deltaproteobacteria bacterium]|nr:hypothetical protein [Deltaproteobacteria bacterium]